MCVHAEPAHASKHMQALLRQSGLARAAARHAGSSPKSAALTKMPKGERSIGAWRRYPELWRCKFIRKRSPEVWRCTALNLIQTLTSNCFQTLSILWEYFSTLKHQGAVFQLIWNFHQSLPKLSKCSRWWPKPFQKTLNCWKRRSKLSKPNFWIF